MATNSTNNPTTFKVEYGVEDKYINVTYKSLEHLAILEGKCMVINFPSTDIGLANYFGDPAYGISKNLRITYKDEVTVYKAGQLSQLRLDHLNDQDVKQIEGILRLKHHDALLLHQEVIQKAAGVERLNLIHQKLKFTGGTLAEEYPEQLMSATYIKSSDRVLELGSNIGRNTLVIASLLEDQNNLVTLECDPNTCVILKKNRDLNNYYFHVEPAALSCRKLIQKGWDTVPIDSIPSDQQKDWKPINTITFTQLEAKYQIKFNTLVADCEGALFYIFKDQSEMLDSINKVIMENDYHDLSHKQFVDDVLREKGFHRIYSVGGGWGPCVEYFFEVWSKENGQTH